MMFSTFSKSVVKQTLTPPFEIRFFSFSKNKRPKTYVVSGKVIKVFFFYIYFWLCAKAKRSLVFVLGLWTQKQGLHLWIHSDVP